MALVQPVRRKILVLLLLLAVTPCAAELVEWAAHLAWHGDFAHAKDDAHAQQAAQDEHGCTTLFHTCGCHASTFSTLTQAITVGVGNLAPSSRCLPAPANRAGRCTEPPPHRPPIV